MVHLVNARTGGESGDAVVWRALAASSVFWVLLPALLPRPSTPPVSFIINLTYRRQLQSYLLARRCPLRHLCSDAVNKSISKQTRYVWLPFT